MITEYIACWICLLGLGVVLAVATVVVCPVAVGVGWVERGVMGPRQLHGRRNVALSTKGDA